MYTYILYYMCIKLSLITLSLNINIFLPHNPSPHLTTAGTSETSAKFACSATGDSVVQSNYASKDCTGAVKDDDVITYPQTWTVQTDDDGKATDVSNKALATCYGGKIYASTTAAAAAAYSSYSSSSSTKSTKSTKAKCSSIADSVCFAADMVYNPRSAESDCDNTVCTSADSYRCCTTPAGSTSIISASNNGLPECRKWNNIFPVVVSSQQHSVNSVNNVVSSCSLVFSFFSHNRHRWNSHSVRPAFQLNGNVQLWRRAVYGRCYLQSRRRNDERSMQMHPDFNDILLATESRWRSPR